MVLGEGSLGDMLGDMVGGGESIRDRSLITVRGGGGGEGIKNGEWAKSSFTLLYGAGEGGGGAKGLMS